MSSIQSLDNSLTRELLLTLLTVPCPLSKWCNDCSRISAGGWFEAPFLWCAERRLSILGISRLGADSFLRAIILVILTLPFWVLGSDGTSIGWRWRNCFAIPRVRFSWSRFALSECVATGPTGIRIAVKRLEEGRVVGVFPEGGIRAGKGSVLEGATMWPGVSALAVLSGKPIVPSVILGTDRLYNRKNWLRFRRVAVWIGFGEKILPRDDLPKRDARELVQKSLSEAFVSLKVRKKEKYANTGIPAKMTRSPKPEFGQSFLNV